jgi:hypothetical protein
MTFSLREFRTFGDYGCGLQEQLNVIVVGMLYGYLSSLKDHFQPSLQAVNFGCKSEKVLKINITQNPEGTRFTPKARHAMFRNTFKPAVSGGPELFKTLPIGARNKRCGGVKYHPAVPLMG